MKKVSFAIDGVDREGLAALSRGGKLWVHLDGETYVFENEKATRGGRSQKGPKTPPSEIAAPMPGKIVKIHIQPGDKVSSGQVLVVMEAMKMEYTLKAQADGEVEHVTCQDGQQVALGQLLVKLKLWQK